MYGKCNTSGGEARSSAAFRKYGSPFYTTFGAGRSGGYARRPKYNVPVNIIENETSYQVWVYALGFEKHNIRISVVDDMLYISGTREIDESQKPNFILQEYPIKSFERVVSLRGQIDSGSITARQEEGILKIVLPKTPEAKKPAQDITVD